MATATFFRAFPLSGTPRGGGNLPADRLATVNWQNAGMQSKGGPSGAGIPNRSTIFTTLSPIGGGADDSAAIQTAVNNCPAGQVVLLNGGDFIVNNLVLISTGITVRGSGAGVTILHKTNGAWGRIPTTVAGTTGILTAVDPGSYAASAAVTISNASPAVVTWTAHGKGIGARVRFTTTGALPAPLAINTDYFVIAAGYATDSFEIATVPWGGAINTTTAGSGTHTGTTFTADVAPIFILGPSTFPGVDESTRQNLTVDGQPGSFSVTIASATGFTVGQFVLLDELTNSSWQPCPIGMPDNGNTTPSTPVQVWAGDRAAWNLHLPYQTFQEDTQLSDATYGPADAKFTATISTTTMTVAGSPAVQGTIAIGQTINDISGNFICTITGGSGITWTISPSQTVSSPTVMFAVPSAYSWFSRMNRVTCEIKEITVVNGNTITFSSPLSLAYRASHVAQLTRYTQFGSASTGDSRHVTMAGVENLTMSGGANGNIRFQNAAYCWAKNVENTQWLNEGVAINGSFRVEYRDSYNHTASWPTPGGAGYSSSWSDGTSEVLFENCISIDANKVMVARACGTGSVVAYNYMDDGWITSNVGWQEIGINASHMIGPHHVLFEGNQAVNADSDYTHGNSIYITYFRNHLTGQRRDFTSDSSNAKCGALASYSWYCSFVGNVLGRSGQMSGWAYTAQAMGCDVNGNNCVGVPANTAAWGAATGNIWQIGYDPERFSMSPEMTSLQTVIRDGNYDFLTNSQRWHNTPATFAMPNSMYLPGKPAFFGANTWPWTDPSTGTIATGSGGFAALPARNRYDNGTPNTP